MLYQCIFRENTSVYGWIWTLLHYIVIENGNSLRWRGFERDDCREKRIAYFEPRAIKFTRSCILPEYDLSLSESEIHLQFNQIYTCNWGFHNEGLGILSLKRAHHYETRRKVHCLLSWYFKSKLSHWHCMAGFLVESGLMNAFLFSFSLAILQRSWECRTDIFFHQQRRISEIAFTESSRLWVVSIFCETSSLVSSGSPQNANYCSTKPVNRHQIFHRNRSELKMCD